MAEPYPGYARDAARAEKVLASGNRHAIRTFVRMASYRRLNKHRADLIFADDCGGPFDYLQDLVRRLVAAAWPRPVILSDEYLEALERRLGEGKSSAGDG